MNRPETALAALLFSVVIVAPAAAQQAPLTPQPAVSEFCSGCFLPTSNFRLCPKTGRLPVWPPLSRTRYATTAGQESPIGARRRAWLHPPDSDRVHAHSRKEQGLAP